jgi:hypothetical protein
MTGFLSALDEIRNEGQFTFLDRSTTTAELNRLMGI